MGMFLMKFPLWVSLRGAWHGWQKLLLLVCPAFFFLAAAAPSESTLKILSSGLLGLQQKGSALIFFS
jgi:hypothetical protein